MKIDIRKISNEIAELAKQQFEYSWEGNSKLANKAYSEGVKLKRILVSNPQILDEITSLMLGSTDNLFMVRQGMLIALSLGVNVATAKEVLRNAINELSDVDINKRRMAFEAKMIKENIDRTGYILLYKGQRIYKVYDKEWFN